MEQMHPVNEQRRRRNIRLALLLGGFVVFNAVISLTLWIHKFNLAAGTLK
jgi:hypothetical protein